MQPEGPFIHFQITLNPSSRLGYDGRENLQRQFERLENEGIFVNRNCRRTPADESETVETGSKSKPDVDRQYCRRKPPFKNVWAWCGLGHDSSKFPGSYAESVRSVGLMRAAGDDPRRSSQR